MNTASATPADARLSGEQLDVSVVFATYRRAEGLETTLQGFAALSTELRWQLIVVDNADDSASQEVLRRFEVKLPLRWLVESRTGKNRALNAALPLLQGELLIFTDDDVLPDPNWLTALHAASCRWPDHTMFGGRILPDRHIPFDLTDPLIQSAYVISNGDQEEGEIQAGRIWGPNMAVRASTFRNFAKAFNETIGPAGNGSYAMGSETEMLLRLEAQGNRAIFVPSAVVKHQIRPEQLSLSWLEARCFRAGRGLARRSPATGRGVWLGVPRYLIRAAPTCWIKRLLARFKDYDVRVRASLEYSFVLGQIAEYHFQSRQGLAGKRA